MGKLFIERALALFHFISKVSHNAFSVIQLDISASVHSTYNSLSLVL